MEGGRVGLLGVTGGNLVRARNCSEVALKIAEPDIPREDMGTRVITFITKSAFTNPSMNALIMGKPHLGSHNSPLPTSALALLHGQYSFIPSSISSFM